MSLKGRFVKNCHLTFSYWATVILWIYTSKFSGFSFDGFVVVVLKNVLKRAHARVPATLFWRETVTVCNVTGKVHQHGSSFVRNKTFPYIQIMDSIPLVFQVYLKFYVCLQSVSCEVCEAFFSINNKSPHGWTQQGKKVLYMFIPEAKPLTLFNIQLFCQKRFPWSNTSLWRLHVLPTPQFLAQQLVVKVLGFTLLCLFNDE